MKILKLKISQIIPNSFNPNEMEEKQFKKLVLKIKKVGYTQPIEVRPMGKEKYEIVDGYHRYLACKEIGLKEIECVISEYDDVSAKIENIAKNKIRGFMNPTSLALMIADLAKVKSIKEIEQETGLDRIEIKDLTELMEITKEEMKALEENTKKAMTQNMFLIDFAVTREQKEIIEKTVKEVMGRNKTNKRGEALSIICKAFVA